jgi:hypothetical protein
MALWSVCWLMAQVALRGTLENGSSGGAGRADEVLLLRLDRGMQTLASLSAVEGAFQLPLPLDEPVGALMVQAVVGRARYSAEVSDPGAELRLTVYENSPQVPIRRRLTTLVFYAVKDSLQIGQFYSLENASSPPFTFQPEGPSFIFSLPKEPTTVELSSKFGSAPDLKHQPQWLEDGRAGLDYPLRPGLTQVIVSTAHAYEAAGFAMELPLPEQERGVHVMAVPPSLQLSGEGLNFVSLDDGGKMGFYEWEPGAASSLSISVQGESASQNALLDEHEAHQVTPETRRGDAPLTPQRNALLLGMLALLASLAALGAWRARPVSPP